MIKPYTVNGPKKTVTVELTESQISILLAITLNRTTELFDAVFLKTPVNSNERIATANAYNDVKRLVRLFREIENDFNNPAL